MRKLKVILVVATFLVIAGCATVKVYSDAEMTKETGLRYYTLKPYLLVEYRAEKDNTVKTTVVYLPDMASPQYMVVKPGIGSGEVKMTLKNGALETYGVITDSKLPESMAAFADILSKSAYAAQNFTGPVTPGTTDQEQGDAFRLFEILFTPEGTVLKEVKL
jgi:hypothetical protein